MSNYEKYLRANMKVIGGARWDELIRQVASDIAKLDDRAGIQDKLADSLLARGLQVIEDLVTPVSLQAQSRVTAIDELITRGTEEVNEAVGEALAAAQNIAEILAGLQNQGVSADLVLETAGRIFLTPSLKVAYDGYAAAITANAAAISTKASPADVAAAIDALKGGVGTAYDTLLEIANKLADDDTAIAGVLTSLANRLRVDTASQGLTGAQQSNARANLGLGDASLRNVSSASELRSNSGDKVVTAGNAWAAGAFVSLGNLSGNVTIDANAGARFYGTLVGNVVIDVINLKDGQAINLFLLQDATGSRTVGWSSKFRWPFSVAPSVNTTASDWAVLTTLQGLWFAGTILGTAWRV